MASFARTTAVLALLLLGGNLALASHTLLPTSSSTEAICGHGFGSGQPQVQAKSAEKALPTPESLRLVLCPSERLIVNFASSFSQSSPVAPLTRLQFLALSIRGPPRS
ncbi:MAG: hypothetical protein K8S54_12285 [Spirochaetia bacterium]|nr:hypothetical protein [Spirochaetia bacterium]